MNRSEAPERMNLRRAMNQVYASCMRRKLKPAPLDASRYAGRWVALHPKSLAVVADGTTLHEAKQKAIRMGITRPVLQAVRKSDGYFVGAA